VLGRAATWTTKWSTRTGNGLATSRIGGRTSGSGAHRPRGSDGLILLIPVLVGTTTMVLPHGRPCFAGHGGPCPYDDAGRFRFGGVARYLSIWYVPFGFASAIDPRLHDVVGHNPS
jgi:hypothetical protein